MMHDVVISLHSVQDRGTENEDIVEFTTDGLYSYDDGIGCMSYMESEVTGMEGTRTSVIAMPDKVVLDRDGLITSRMIFQPGQKSSFLYETPYGSAALSVDTRKISRSLGALGGSLEIDYVVGVEHALISKNSFRINVEMQKPTGGMANV